MIKNMLTILLLSLTFLTIFDLKPATALPGLDTGVVIPLYNYPDSTWTTIVNARTTSPNVPIIAIVNPDSGPGSSADPAYLSGIQELQAAGVTVIGYVTTGYAAISPLTIEGQAKDYLSWYSVNGIFFDEMSNTAGNEAYYSALNAYVKSLGMTFTMGNPGTSVPISDIGIFNNLVIYEYSAYPSLSTITYPGYSTSGFSLIAYGVSYDPTFVTSASSLVSYMYIDNESGANPYATLSSLFLQTEATLSTLDSSPITATITIRSESVSSGLFTGMWLTINSGGTIIASGYTTFMFTGKLGNTYTVCMSNYQNITFYHWGNRRTNPCKTIVLDSNTTITAWYKT